MPPAAHARLPSATGLPPTHPRSSLHIFLHGMLARRVEIVGDATGDEAAPRPTIEDSRLTLPADFWPGPARDTLCRAAAAHALAHWRHSPRAQATGGLTAIGRRVADAIEDARAEALLLRDYPGLRALWAPCHDATESLGLSPTRCWRASGGPCSTRIIATAMPDREGPSAVRRAVRPPGRLSLLSQRPPCWPMTGPDACALRTGQRALSALPRRRRVAVGARYRNDRRCPARIA